MSNSPNPKPVELYSIKSEAEAQTGMVPEGGIWSSMNLVQTADAHPKIIWKDKLLTFDLWQRDGQTMIVIYCPKCLHSLRIDSSRKKIEWSEEDGLAVEPMVCTWELPDADGREGDRVIAGLNLCRWTVEIQPVNRTVDTIEGKIRIHGIARDA